METLWFWTVAATVALYLAFGGLHLGAGLAWPFVAREPGDAGMLRRTLRPFFDGSELWLVASAVLLISAYPQFQAASQSELFYPLAFLLALLLLRGLAIRLHPERGASSLLWGRLFVLTSCLLVFAYGLALGNFIRGFPLDANGQFYLPILHQADSDICLLRPYPIFVGVSALILLWRHGCIWFAARCQGPARLRARRLALFSTWPLLGLFLALTLASFLAQPNLRHSFIESPVGGVFPAATVACLVISIPALRFGHESQAFFASTTMLVSLVLSAAFASYPWILPGFEEGTGVHVSASAAAEAELGDALLFGLPGVLLLAVSLWVLLGRMRQSREGKLPSNEPR
ncbi:MAG: hypothetical protein CSA62_04445 [Planctomycetota bacterium]|nr:MAG: hypothetical protein CSA62_04445 [Planctomycetota bacterium]